MGVRQRPPIPVFPRPEDRYDPEEEGQFRLSIQRAIENVIGYLTEYKLGTPAALGVGDNDDYAIGVSDFLRLSANAGASALTGIAGGVRGRRLVIVNLANSLTLEHEDAASAVSNRIITGTGAAVTLAANDMAELIYDDTSARWRILSTAV